MRVDPKHPRDAFISVYGRKPVLEALERPDVVVDKVLIAHEARGPIIDRIVAAAKRRGVATTRTGAREVGRLSRNLRQDQGVVADVVAPRMDALDRALALDGVKGPLVALDGVTTPANVGLIIRTVTAAGLGGIVLPRKGCPEVGPLVVKASAGLAFGARILRTPDLPTALDALRRAGFRIVGLASGRGSVLWDADIPDASVLVLGRESSGLTVEVEPFVESTLRIPMAEDVESLNVAVAAAIVAFEVVRRRHGHAPP